MVAGNKVEIITPGKFVHPRQTYLWNRLQGDLPEGAHDLCREVIAEYQSAFENYKKGTGEINSHLTVSLSDDGGGDRILAGKVHTLTVQLGESVKDIEELFTHLAVVIRPRNMEGSVLYPDWIRYPALDLRGNSRPTRFMLKVPDSLRGYDGVIPVSVFNGGNHAARVELPVKIV